VLVVRRYIDNQDRHHRTKTFGEELDEFIAADFAKEDVRDNDDEPE
jgi:hypothetical protein